MIETYRKTLQDFALKHYDSITSYWANNTIDYNYGGFYGRIDDDNNVDSKAEKGLILNARILWSFASAYQHDKNTEWLEICARAYKYLKDNFKDGDYPGYYWSLDYLGNPLQTKKQVYAQAFVMYAFAEYYKCTSEKSVLDDAIEIYYALEKHAVDKKNDGYYEAFTREWNEIPDQRLSDKDMNEKKSMNTHLHVLEAYGNLYRVWPDETLRKRMVAIINIFLNYIISDQDNHQMLFFDENWKVKSTQISYGHDIETSWLLYEAAEIIHDNELIEKVGKAAVHIAEGTIEAVMPDGGMYHEGDRNGKHSDTEREWWTQAEAVVGFVNAGELSKDKKYYEMALKVAKFIDDYQVDSKNGEWFCRIDKLGKPVKGLDKVGFWKCPYHNLRMCLEIIRRCKE